MTFSLSNLLKKVFSFFLVFFLLIGVEGILHSHLLKASESESIESKKTKEDFSLFLRVAGKSSYKQFLIPQSLTTLGVGAASVYGISQYDDKGVKAFSENEWATHKATSLVGNDIATFSMLAPAATYGIARYIEDEKLKNFSIEAASSILLVSMEIVLISQYPWHPRPKEVYGMEDQTFFEDTFRGRSSFTSGHVVAPFLLTMKTYDYYGFFPTLIPAAFSVATASARIGDKAHYPTDIAGSFFLCLAGHYATKQVMNEETGQKEQKQSFIYAVPYEDGALLGMRLAY